MRELLEGIRLLHDADDIVEIRSFSPKPVLSGYFCAGDTETIQQQLSLYPNRTFYQTMNPVHSDCYARKQHDSIIAGPEQTTADNNICRHNWILIDCDPVRASGVSASDGEKAAAKKVAESIYSYLRNAGFAEPLICDSGNGYHLLYKIKMNCSSSDIIKRFLSAMDMLFSTDAVKIDTAVYNPARVTKLYGTVAHKGADTPERPHRRSAILRFPEPVELTSSKLIEAVTDAIIPKEEKKKIVHHRSNISKDDFDVGAFVRGHSTVKRVVPVAGGIRYDLEACPFDPAHKDAAVFVLNDGRLGFKCFHNSCADKHWHDYRAYFEPEAYDMPRNTANTSSASAKRSLTAASIEALSKETKPTGAIMLDISEIAEEDRTRQVCVKSGIGALDALIGGFNLGEVTVWSGGNGAGKSSLVSQIALYAVSTGHKVVIFSGELKAERIKSWTYRQAAGPDFVHEDVLRPGVWQTDKDAREELDDYFKGKIGIYNNEYGTDWENVIEKAIIPYVKEREADVVVVDNLMALDIPLRTVNPIEAQSQAIKAFAGMAKKLNLHIHFVCHPRKTQAFLRKEDISGSADLTNQADNVIMVHRCGADFYARCKEFYKDRTPKESEGFGNVIEIMKNRENGVQDELIPLYFNPVSKTMTDVRGGRLKFDWMDQLNIRRTADRIFPV